MLAGVPGVLGVSGVPSPAALASSVASRTSGRLLRSRCPDPPFNKKYLQRGWTEGWTHWIALTHALRLSPSYSSWSETRGAPTGHGVFFLSGEMEYLLPKALALTIWLEIRQKKLQRCNASTDINSIRSSVLLAVRKRYANVHIRILVRCLESRKQVKYDIPPRNINVFEISHLLVKVG